MTYEIEGLTGADHAYFFGQDWYEDEEDDDNEEGDEMSTCQCPYCYCNQRGDFVVCDDCLAGAHQG